MTARKHKMVKVTNPAGTTVYIAKEAIAEVREAEASSEGHGIRAIVKTFDSRLIEVVETTSVIAEQLNHGGAP